LSEGDVRVEPIEAIPSSHCLPTAPCCESGHLEKPTKRATSRSGFGQSPGSGDCKRLTLLPLRQDERYLHKASVQDERNGETEFVWLGIDGSALGRPPPRSRIGKVFMSLLSFFRPARGLWIFLETFWLSVIETLMTGGDQDISKRPRGGHGTGGSSLCGQQSTKSATSGFTAGAA